MDFSLSSSLVGNAVSNPDKLALDLQFAADKTLTARKGPTPVFTRASTGRFVGSNGLIQSAAINTPRFDHDPVTGVCRGLLMEESRTNSLAYSEDFANAYWTKTGVNTPSNTSIAPNGNSVNTSLVAFNSLYPSINKSIAITTGSTVTLSVFAKQLTTSILSLELRGTSSGPDATFDLSNGTATGIGVITPFGNGWYRCSISKVINAATVVVIIGMGLTPSVGNSILIWGAQMEIGSFPTSYIPTTTASVVRSADVCTITGSAFSGFYNQPEGTLFADVTPQTVAQASVVMCVNTTSFQSAHLIYKIDPAFNAAGRRWAGQTSVGPAAQTAIVTSTDVAISRSRLSYAYKLNDFAFAYAGEIVGTDNLGTIPSPTAMRIGARDDGLSINGHLATVRYYKKRLSNPRLQAITV